jgi:hypothetical protein
LLLLLLLARLSRLTVLLWVMLLGSLAAPVLTADSAAVGLVHYQQQKQGGWPPLPLPQQQQWRLQLLLLLLLPPLHPGYTVVT